jgi:hypothetical protein
MSENNFDYDESSESEYEEDDEEIKCKNLDPVLAKLMGLIIEEQKEIIWKPPMKPGLDNSEKIISSNYCKNSNLNIDFFKVIKDDIINYKKLTDRQLEYIKNLNNEEKFELIQLYDKMIEVTINNLP